MQEILTTHHHVVHTIMCSYTVGIHVYVCVYMYVYV